MKRLDLLRGSRRGSLQEARKLVAAGQKDAVQLAAAEEALQAEEARKAAALSSKQAVREQMRLWWRFPDAHSEASTL